MTSRRFNLRLNSPIDWRDLHTYPGIVAISLGAGYYSLGAGLITFGGLLLFLALRKP